MAAADRVLIVDDDPDTRFLLEGILRQEGFETLCAEDGQKALALLEQQHFDLVLTDRKMSGLDGLALISEIWKLHPDIGTAMISGFRGPETESLCTDPRVLAYFEKPIYDLRQVAVHLKDVLQKHKRGAVAP